MIEGFSPDSAAILEPRNIQRRLAAFPNCLYVPGNLGISVGMPDFQPA
jgi:hypothetical protein